MKSIAVLGLAASLWTGMFWNLENFFDYSDDGSGVSDAEFSSRGRRHWTRKRFDAKIEMVGKTLLWADAPDVVGVCEVENARVLRRLCGSDALRKIGYRHVHYESSDPRGIDVGLLYRSDRLRVERSRRVRVLVPAGSGPVAVDTLKTRDILYVCLEESSGRRWHVLVNHHPSKYGGSRSEARRIAVMRCMLAAVDSVLLADPSARIVCMGDFNDTPFSPAMTLAANHMLPLSETGKQAGLVNLGAALPATAGTIRFQGKWELIDNFLVTPNVDSICRMTILQPPFLMERDRKYPGMKPKRTYIGPRYNGGVSDHLPIMISVK